MSKFAEKIHEVLWHHWDPIGVRDAGAPEDEYDSYIPLIGSLISSGVDESSIAEELLRIERDWMGLPGNAAHALSIARKLKALR